MARETLGRGIRPARMTAATMAPQRDEPSGPAKRTYRVTVGFRHPVDPAALTEAELESLPAGDSGLCVASDAVLVYGPPEGSSADLHISLTRNPSGRLARARAIVDASSTLEARGIVMPIVGLAVSRLAFEYGALIAQHWIEVVNVETSYRELGMVERGEDVVIPSWPDWAAIPGAFFRTAFAVYREGLITLNPYYGLLCFQRVIEGTRHCRGAQSKYARRMGVDHARAPLLFEQEEGIVGPFVEMVGRSCDAVADMLYTHFRIPVAHGVRLDEPLLAADQLQVENRYWLSLPPARQVAHKFLRAELDFRTRLGAGPIPELDKASFA